MQARSPKKSVVQLDGYSSISAFALGAALWLGLLSQTSAAVLYVNAVSDAPSPPYSDWSTAATTLQDAVDAASPGDEVVVTNGVYASGGRAVVGTMTNRVAITKRLTVRSVNGPAVTTIQGRQVPGSTNGDGAIRCAYLTNGAILSGFTLTGGATRASTSGTGEGEGGGVWCAANSAIVTNCVIIRNAAVFGGGGAVGGTLLECIVATNVVHGAIFGSGGGCWQGTLIRCSLIGNASGPSGGRGGGAFSSSLVECLVVNNSANSGGGASGSTLRFCTISDNIARVDPDSVNGGGGASDSRLFNCALIRNQSAYGGGAQNCVLNNCAISANTAIRDGGGAWGCGLTNCTVTGNWANYGGGVHAGTTVNSIVYHNSARQSFPNHSVGIAPDAMNYSCTFPSLTNGIGNITNEPALASLLHLSAASPCVGAGAASRSTGVDIDGELWATPPSMGCDEYRVGSVTGVLSVAISAPWTNTSTGFALGLTANIDGRVSASVWDFGDGMVVTNRPFVSHAWNVPGDYPVVLTAYNESHPEGVRAALTVKIVPQPVHYVAVDSPNPSPPYMSWETAARSIQEAVDAAGHGGLVLVSNGVYATGGRTVLYSFGFRVSSLINRVHVDRPITVQSVNGPEVTVIKGTNRIRCVYLTNGATLSGFTLTNGITSQDDRFENRALQGGGAWCESTNAVLTNCIVAQCQAYYEGGGVFSGTLYQCRILGGRGNVGGGAAVGVLKDCILSANAAGIGGGAWECKLERCFVSDNSASLRGGGAYGGTVTDSILARNRSSDGAGLFGATAYNCTIADNRGIRGGGASSGTLNNCIVFYNVVTNTPFETASGANVLGGVANFSCLEPLPTNGVGNFTNAPLFAGPEVGDFSLQSASSCINAGRNSDVVGSLDLDGKPRIVGGAVDVGAYEFQSPASVISYVWLRQYGLPIDGTADSVDADNDGLTNQQEWRSGTNPTNASSVLRFLTPQRSGSRLALRWQSVAGVNYFLERSTNLSATPFGPFEPLATNISGQAGNTIYLDTNNPPPAHAIYRLSVP